MWRWENRTNEAQVLFSLGPKQIWEKEALLPMRGVALHDGQRTSSVITPELLQEAQVQPWFTNPNQTREQYERRRRAANERSMRFTRVAAVVLGLPEWLFQFFPTPVFLSLARWMGRHPSLLRRALQSAATAFQEPSH